MRKSFISLTALTLTGVAFAVPAPVVELEPIQVTKIAQSGDFMPGPGSRPRTPSTTISITAQSNGCTDAKDFEVKVKKDGDKQLVSIIRTSPDLCRKVSSWESVEIETDAIGLSQKTMNGRSNVVYQSNPITIANPLPVEDNTTH